MTFFWTTRPFRRSSQSTVIACWRGCPPPARRRRILVVVGHGCGGGDAAARGFSTNYLRDVFRTRSLTPGNPLIKALMASTSEEYLSYLPLIEADHVMEAIGHVREQQALVRSSSRYQNSVVFAVEPPALVAAEDTDTTNTATTKNEETAVASSIQELIRALNDLEDPALSLRQMCAMMVHLGPVNASSTVEWRTAAAAVSKEFRPFQDLTLVPLGRLQNMKEWLRNHQPRKSTPLDDEVAIDDRQQAGFAVDWLLHQYQTLTGDMDLAGGGNRIINGEDDTTRYREYRAMLEEIELNLLSAKSFTTSPTLLSHVYNYIGLRTALAKLLGHDNAVDQALRRSTVTTIADIDALHHVVEHVIAPEIQRFTGAKSADEMELESYLMPTSSSLSSAESIATMGAKQMEIKKDEFFMMKLEEHVTLDGALQFLFQLLNTLTGITFEPVTKSNGSLWSETKTYRAFDEGTCIGMLLIDPLTRPDSTYGAVSIPVIARSATRTPFICLSLSIKPPAWKGDPIRVNWEDCESLFHELGHCVQLFLGQSELGSVLGPANLPADASEFLPKFMEHWLTEESTVKAMINLSQCNGSFTEETFMAAQRVRSRTKMLMLAEQAFQSKLEISFLSEFDLKGSETIMDRQASIARRFVPHANIEKNNLEPLIDVMKRNATGHHVAAYRYLWADFASASVFAALKESHHSNPESALKRFRADVRQSGLLAGAASDFSKLLRPHADKTLTTTDFLKLYKIW